MCHVLPSSTLSAAQRWFHVRQRQRPYPTQDRLQAADRHPSDTETLARKIHAVPLPWSQVGVSMPMEIPRTHGCEKDHHYTILLYKLQSCKIPYLTGSSTTT